mgnify:CR=1 FL=1
MNSTENSLSDQLATTVSNTGSIGLSAEIAEFAIDQVLDSGILKDIPFVGWIAKGLSINQNISDRILYSKILRFLAKLESISSADKSEFQKRICEDHDYRRDVGEHLLNFIDRLDDLKKTDVLASCFNHFLAGDIVHDHFIELASVIDRLTSRDLAVLATPRSQRVRFTSVGRAVASGVMEYDITESVPGDESPTIAWRMTSLGKDLRDILLGEFPGRVEFRKRTPEEIRRIKESLKI